MLIQLALGVMSLPAMVAVASVIAFEKLSRPGELVARLSALAAVAGGTGLAWVSLG
jgi:predicted metal-binding membrane protein